MACRRGGGGRGRRGRGDQRPPYGHGGAGGTGAAGRLFVWLTMPSTPRPVMSAPYPVPGLMGYRGPMVLPHQGAYGVPMAVYRSSGQPSAASASPRQQAPEPAPAPAASSAPSPAALAKEVEKKLFVSETALALPAAAAAVAAAQGTAAAGSDDDASDVDLAPVSKKGLAHPARPGLATVGKKVMIRANHFLVNVADNNLFHYDVAINPESESRATNREVLNELIKLHGKTGLGGKLPAYDGRKSLYTAGSLLSESEEFVVALVDPEKEEKERAEREYKITIRTAGRTDLYHLQQFLRGGQRDMPQETIQVLDVVLRESPSWNYVTVSRSFFSTTFGHRGDIGEGLECWRGYYQSLRPTQMGLSLNIDISATSFFKPVTVFKFVEEFLNLRDTPRPLSGRDRVKIKKALRGVRIETTHQQDQIRRYKIAGVTAIPMSQLIFPVDDKGTRKTVVQYFWDKYNYRMKYGSWPSLQAGSDSRPVYLPMEVCKILEGQRYSKKLNDRQVTNTLRATCKRPQEREQSIRDMVLHNKYADDKFAQEFGIQVSSDLVTVPARVLPPPLLKYHDSGREKICAPSVGQWNMINEVASMDRPEITKHKCLVPPQGWYDADDQIQNCSDLIKVTVFLLDEEVEVFVKMFSTLDFTVSEAMHKLGIYLHDVYFLCDGKTVQASTVLHKSCILRSRHRLRGGHRNAPIPFESVIKSARLQRCFFERVDLPVDLQMFDGASYVIGLGDVARHLYCMLTKALEDVHSDGYTYYGNFNIHDIWYLPDYDIVEIRKESKKSLDQGNYMLDLRVLLTVLNMSFMYTNRDGIDRYPMFMEDLRRWIVRLTNSGKEYMSKVKRATVYLNPVGWSAASRIKFFDSLMIHYHKLSKGDKGLFRAALGQGSTRYGVTYSWKAGITSPAMRRFQRKSPHRKSYPDNYYGRLDFSRCFTTHVENITEKQADAAIYLLAREQIIQLLNLLLLKYKPSIASSADGQIKAADASVSASPISSIAVAHIPRKNTVEVFHYFGFICNPLK